MSASSGIAAAKRRRGASLGMNIQQDSNVDNQESNKSKVTITRAVSLHEDKLTQLYKFHLDDKERIDRLENLCESYLLQIKNMEAYIKDLCNEHNETVVQIEELEDKMKVIEAQHTSLYIKKTRKSTKKEAKNEELDSIKEENVEADEHPTFPSITDDNILFSTTELDNTSLDDLGDLSNMGDLPLDD